GLVGADEVALDQVAVGVLDLDPVVAVAGEDVAVGRLRPADHVAAGPALDVDAVRGIPELLGAGGVGADQVALHHGAGDGFVVELHAVDAAGRDDVAQDQVIRPEQDHAVARVAQGLGAGHIGADPVVLGHVAAGVAAAGAEADAVVAVAGDQVAVR